MRRRIARARSSGGFAWSVAALLISLIAIAPVIAIFVLALQSSGDTWPHLIANVLPGALRRTLALMAGVGALTLLIGTGTAWLVTMYRFPGRSLFQWLLLLPLAMPTYIIAYCFLELFDYSGALQTSLRQVFGWHSAKDYWFPDIRSVGGAIFVMSMVLYPYVYITARASFLAQSVCVLEVSRTLGRSAAATFFEVALPLARPALAAGVALTLMETLNDIGAVEFFGVRTLTVAVYDTWLDRNSLAGAAQIACIMLAFVFAVLATERTLRASRRYHHTTGRYRHLPEATLSGAAGVFAVLACALPVLIGFVLPASVLVHDALAHIASGLAPEFWQAALHSLMLSASAACLAVAFAVVLGYARRQTRSKLVQTLSIVPAISYAVPGTVLAIGLLIPLATLDNAVDAAMRSLFDLPTGLLLSGSAFAMVLAYTIRFLAASLGAVEAGLEQDLAQHRCRGAHPRRHGDRDLVAGASAAASAGTRRRGPPRLRRLDEGAAGNAPAPPLQFRYALNAGLHARLALPLRGGRPLGADHRGCEPRPGSPSAWRHCRRTARRLVEPARRGSKQRTGRGRGTLDKSINSGAGLAISGQPG